MLTKTKLLASKKHGEQLKTMKIGLGASESFKSMLVIKPFSQQSIGLVVFHEAQRECC